MLIIDHEMNVNNKSLITIFCFFDVSRLNKMQKEMQNSWVLGLLKERQKYSEEDREDQK